MEDMGVGPRLGEKKIILNWYLSLLREAQTFKV